MTHRHIFRMMHYSNVEQILKDEAVYAKNYHAQPGFQISYNDIVNKRGTDFKTPDGNVVNDYVPFYFSPMTSMAYTIAQRNVPLCDPSGTDMGKANMDDVIFIISNTSHFQNTELSFWFTDVACNSGAVIPAYENDLSKLKDHVEWALFDDKPTVALIPEIGYNGACQWFHDCDKPPERSNRSTKRMAEFMVKDCVPLTLIDCIVTKDDRVKQIIETCMQVSKFNIPVHVNPGCYY